MGDTERAKYMLMTVQQWGGEQPPCFGEPLAPLLALPYVDHSTSHSHALSTLFPS